MNIFMGLVAGGVSLFALAAAVTIKSYNMGYNLGYDVSSAEFQGDMDQYRVESISERNSELELLREGYSSSLYAVHSYCLVKNLISDQ